MEDSLVVVGQELVVLNGQVQDNNQDGLVLEVSSQDGQVQVDNNLDGLVQEGNSQVGLEQEVNNLVGQVLVDSQEALKRASSTSAAVLELKKPSAKFWLSESDQFREAFPDQAEDSGANRSSPRR